MPGTVAVIAFDLITALGRGAAPTWEALLAGRTAIAPPRRTYRAAFEVAPVAESSAVDPGQEDSAAWQLCRALCDQAFLAAVPGEAELFLATTVGEIEILERAADSGADASGSRLTALCARLEARLGREPGQGTIVSAACASGSTAVALAAQRIRLGLATSAVIVACDGVSEFVLAGFNALMAVDKGGAHPFDRARQGLSLGEGAAYLVLMDEAQARKTGRPVLATVDGWGLSDDANHITGPARDGSGLAAAIAEALRGAGAVPGQVAFISAHGTGTVYNDAMEMQAFKRVFAAPVPIYGVKGALGHTLGAAGLIETGLAVEALRRGCIPPTVGLREPDPEAAGWVSPATRAISGSLALCVNAGFGGVNAALCLRGVEIDPAAAR